MSGARLVAVACAAASLAGCASLRARQPAAERSEIVVSLAVPAECASALVMSAFGKNQLEVTSSHPGVVEARLPRQRGLSGYYDLFARAVITPGEKGTTTVTLFAEETQYADDGETRVGSSRASERSQGRAAEVWTKLQGVARTLRSESAKA
jgi:hypothetical protein